MYEYILIVLVHNTLAFKIYEPESASPNVGTVLFTKSDLYKKRWNKDKIKLLQARKYLQHLIPSPHLIDTINEEYLNNLLSYYNESYNTVKREVKNPKVNHIMNTALSDALGGYLKVWILPITKYAYYGGTISMEKAMKIFQVFEDIKRNLKTDGRNWRNPNEDLLKSVAIDVISWPRTASTRSMKDPCKHLAYYEKTNSDLSIPLPIINWNMLPITIFVPLKNQSLLPISSPNSSNILFNYYDIAENCMQAQRPTSSDNFKQKFQTWLSTDVAPHLNDDNLYIAFGSVLSLMNDTKTSFGSFSKSCNDKYEKLKAKTLSLGSPMHECSKKYIIIAIILLVEVIWCIPSLFYIIRIRRRKRNRSLRSYCCELFKRKPKNDNNNIPFYKKIKQNKHSYLFDNLHKGKHERAVKLSFKPRVKTLEVDVQYPSCDSKYMSIKSSKSYNQNISSNQTSNKFLKKPSLNKILPEFDCLKSNHSNNTCNDPNDLQNLDKVTKNSKHKRRDLKSMPTLTVIQDERTIKEINYSQESILKKPQTEVTKLQCKCCINADRNAKKCSNQCPCTSCLDEEVIVTETKNKTTLSKPNPVFKSAFEKFRTKEKKPPYKTTMHTKVDEKAQSNKRIFEKNKIKTDSDKISKAKNAKPLLRIRIERPQTEIKVGIASIREHSKTKPSRIPRLAIKREIKEENHVKGAPAFQNNERLKVDKTILRKKNLKEKTLDDTAIKRTSTIVKKLNLTL